MADIGILPGRLKERVVLRVRAIEPYSSELTAEQVGIIADIAETYGSGAVHITSRQSIEIPDIEYKYLGDIKDRLLAAGLYTGSTGRYLRNIIACSRWCLYNAIPVSDLAQRLNMLFRDRTLPGKTDISLSGCDFSCTRSRTSDIGIIARADIELSGEKCKKCSLCIKDPLGCQVDAIELRDDTVVIDYGRCVRCGFCTNVCKPGTIKVISRGYDIFVGGKGGMLPGEGSLLKTVYSEDDVIDEVDRILERYSSVAEEGDRIGDVIGREGIGVFDG
jgi:dissimilatory sulfite reductase (desulfoviridin) alpha/beta subunit